MAEFHAMLRSTSNTKDESMGQSVANLVDMRDVSFTRGDRCIFDNISLTVPRGKVTAIMGPISCRFGTKKYRS